MVSMTNKVKKEIIVPKRKEATSEKAIVCLAFVRITKFRRIVLSNWCSNTDKLIFA